VIEYATQAIRISGVCLGLMMKKAQLAFEGTVEELAAQHEIREKYLEV
jgi:hypothetical protein